MTAKPSIDFAALDAATLAAVSANVRAARVAANLNQDALAAAADLAPERIAAIESALMEPTMVDLLRIARALGQPPASLLVGIDPTTMKTETHDD